VNEQIFYLDYDGVLHRQLTLQQSRRGQSLVLFEFAERLERMLGLYPSAKMRLGLCRSHRPTRGDACVLVRAATLSLAQWDSRPGKPKSQQVFRNV
jgi:hypothetical protein